jgi:hypothetical protein
MAYDARLAHRLGDIYANIKGVAEKKMFGGLAFMVSGHMSCGIVNDAFL